MVPAAVRPPREPPPPPRDRARVPPGIVLISSSRSLTRASAIAQDPQLRPPDSLARIANEPKDPRRSEPIDRDSNAATPPPREKRRRVEGGRVVRGRGRADHATSNRSRVMTLSHALTKSCTNFALASSDAYPSTGERRCELESKTRSTAMVVQRVSPVARSRPSEKGDPLFETLHRWAPGQRQFVRRAHEHTTRMLTDRGRSAVGSDVHRIQTLPWRSEVGVPRNTRRSSAARLWWAMMRLGS
jgi:hypothetical protein